MHDFQAFQNSRANYAALRNHDGSQNLCCQAFAAIDQKYFPGGGWVLYIYKGPVGLVLHQRAMLARIGVPGNPFAQEKWGKENPFCLWGSQRIQGILMGFSVAHCQIILEAGRSVYEKRVRFSATEATRHQAGLQDHCGCVHTTAFC